MEDFLKMSTADLAIFPVQAAGDVLPATPMLRRLRLPPAFLSILIRDAAGRFSRLSHAASTGAIERRYFRPSPMLASENAGY